MTGRGARKADATGRSTSTYKPRKSTVSLPSQQFTALPREMLESPAWRLLSHPAMKALFRLCIEHMAHGGAENGNLCVTHRQFVAAGMSHNSVKPALIELEALGFAEMMMQGGKSFGDTRLPNRLRLTFVQGKRCDPTHEWHGVRDEEHGRELIAAARVGWQASIARDPDPLKRE